MLSIIFSITLSFHLILHFLGQIFGYPNQQQINRFVPVPVPSGVYLGGFSNTQGTGANNLNKEQDLEAIETSIGRPLAFQLHYYSLSTLTVSNLAADQTIQGDITYKRFPLISATCEIPLTKYTNGSYDKTIDSAALALKNLQIPVGMRFFHEFNLCLPGGTSCQNGDNPACYTSGTDAQEGAQFVAAWEHIWTRFKADGANNVSFIWCPNGNATDLAAHNLALWLPPSPYVDWIAWDVYDKTNAGFVATMSPFYNAFSSYGYPMIITETGEINNTPNYYTQAQYFNDMGSYAQTKFPQLHGISYFSSHPNPSYNWILDPSGITSLTTLANTPYFKTYPYQ